MSVKRLQDLEGELLIDHRNSPGMPRELLANLPPQAGRGIYEGPIYTCSHCQAGVSVIVTAFGGREKRSICSGCQKVICESCAKEKASTGVCRTFEQKVDEHLNALERGILLLP